MPNWLNKLFRATPQWEEPAPSPLSSATIRIAAFVETRTDQKLHDVYAFCEDGRMEFDSFCRCLLGVFGSETPHEWCSARDGRGIPYHYSAIKRLPGMAEIELAYCQLGFNETDELDEWEFEVEGGFPISGPEEQLRNLRLLGILGAEITRRELAKPETTRGTDFRSRRSAEEQTIEA
jgi:hypothetical protein